MTRGQEIEAARPGVEERTPPDHPRERLIIAAAGYSHLWGPDVSQWPEFAAREVDAWMTLVLNEHRRALGFNVKESEE